MLIKFQNYNQSVKTSLVVNKVKLQVNNLVISRVATCKLLRNHQIKTQAIRVHIMRNQALIIHKNFCNRFNPIIQLLLHNLVQTKQVHKNNRDKGKVQVILVLLNKHQKKENLKP